MDLLIKCVQRILMTEQNIVLPVVENWAAASGWDYVELREYKAGHKLKKKEALKAQFPQINKS